MDEVLWNKTMATLELAHSALRAVDASDPTIPQTESTMELISGAVDAVERLMREFNIRDEMVAHLVDAMVMFEQIKHNRNLPPFAQTQNQYISKGNDIRKFLTSRGLFKETI